MQIKVDELIVHSRCYAKLIVSDTKGLKINHAYKLINKDTNESLPIVVLDFFKNKMITIQNGKARQFIKWKNSVLTNA